MSKNDELPIREVEIPFPDGSRHSFKIIHSSLITHHPSLAATASVIKDAGDDPDITNGAEIMAQVKLLPAQDDQIVIKGGKGVGTVTKPGLAVEVGEPAINPVPRMMITEAVAEVIKRYGLPKDKAVEITISVTDGEELAKKTLNARLGIVGGISILGTSGIVRPLSAEAWTASITASMDVAKAAACPDIVLSAGRVSEKAHMKRYHLPDESYVMMGDYVEFSFLDALKHDFKRVHISAHWAKMLKIAMRIPQTHVRHGAIDLKDAVSFLNRLSPGTADPEYIFNTAREIFDIINRKPDHEKTGIYKKVCQEAKSYAESVAVGAEVKAHLVSYEGEIIAESE